MFPTRNLTFKLLNFHPEFFIVGVVGAETDECFSSSVLSHLHHHFIFSSGQKHKLRLSKETKNGSMSVKQEMNIQVTLLLSPPHLSISSSAPLLPLFTFPFLSPLLICPLLSHSSTSNVSAIFFSLQCFFPLLHLHPSSHFFFSPPPYLLSSPRLLPLSPLLLQVRLL